MEVGPGYKKTEVGVIPEDWDSTTVRGIASPIRNAIVGGPFGSNLVSKDYVDDGIPVVRGQNMGSKFVSGRFVFVSQAKGASLEANLAQAGDLVFTQRGTVGQVSLVPDQPHDRYLISQSQMKLTVNREVADPLFFYYVFNSEKQQEVIRQNKVQTGVPHINLGILRDLPVPQPPPVEQEIIAEALSDADALIESLEQLLTKKRQIKKGAMQELLTGRKRLPGLSEEWEVKRLGEFVSIRNQKALPSGLDVDTLCIELDHIGQGDGRLFEYSAAQYSTSSKYRFCSGDVLFGRLRSYLRKFWLADRDGICSTEIWPLMVDPEQARSDFLYAIVQSDEFIATANISYGTHMPRADWDIVRNFSVSLPKPKEQTAIATILSDMDAEITAFEAKLSKARLLKHGMMQELLTGRIRLV